MIHSRSALVGLVLLASGAAAAAVEQTTAPGPASSGRLAALAPVVQIGAADCTSSKVGSSIAASAIGEPVGRVSVSEPRWVDGSSGQPSRCEVDGAIAPVDPAAPNINFRVLLPAGWNRRSAQLGGGGMNGTIPNLLAGHSIEGRTPHQLGFATYGSDSGHQAAFGGRRGGGPPAGAPAGAAPNAGAAQPATTAPRAGGGPPATASNDWALNEEAIRNLGYLQMKKTRDAAMVIIERVYGERPRFNYYLGTSQGGREGLTVVQRYPADYDGVIADVPIVNFSSLMLGPELIRIHEKPASRWVTLAKVNAIRGEFMRQCDGLDGAVDGVINHYAGCRAIFDVSRGAPNRRPWAAKRCANNVDPNPADTSADACLTDEQISTLEFVYRPYAFATPLANGVRSFGMWVPNTDPSGSGLILPARVRGQEGAAADAPMHTHLGVLGVTGFLMQDVNANPLDYVEGGSFNARRQFLSAILDSTNPDLSAFAKRGGKLIVTIGTNDTLASPGAQLDYYQAVLERMGRSVLDGFARFFVIPQAGHGLSGAVYSTSGSGQATAGGPLPNSYEKFGTLIDWVERGITPGKTLVVSNGDRSLPLCSYPEYPRYVSGPTMISTSYRCAE